MRARQVYVELLIDWAHRRETQCEDRLFTTLVGKELADTSDWFGRKKMETMTSELLNPFEEIENATNLV
jgi:hypothetical protein